MASVIEGWREFRREIQGATRDATDLGAAIGVVEARTQRLNNIMSAAEKQKERLDKILSQPEATLGEGGVLRLDDLGSLDQGVLRLGDLGSFNQGVLGDRVGASSAGGGGGSRGPSGKSGDPVSCDIPGTEDAINNQTGVLGGWLKAIFDASSRKSTPGQYIGKNLQRPGNGGA